MLEPAKVQKKGNCMTHKMPAMTQADSIAINQVDISRLASLNWQRDGCPPGLELDYYRQAEKQFEALRNLLAYDRKAVTDGQPAPHVNHARPLASAGLKSCGRMAIPVLPDLFSETPIHFVQQTINWHKNETK